MWDPRYQDLDAAAHRLKDRSRSTGLRRLPTLALIFVLPVLLIARAAAWAWRKIRRR